MTDLHCSTATIASSFDIPVAAGLHFIRLDPDELRRLVRRYRSLRSAVVVSALSSWIERCRPALPEPDRRGLVLGTATGAGPDIALFLEESIRVGDHLVNPALFPMTVHNAAAGNAALATNCQGPNIVVNAGTDSARAAVAAACDLIGDGSVDIVFAGGFESRTLDDGLSGTVAAFVAVTSSPSMLGDTKYWPIDHHFAANIARAQLGGDSPDADTAVAALISWTDAPGPPPPRAAAPAPPDAQPAEATIQ